MLNKNHEDRLQNSKLYFPEDVMSYKRHVPLTAEIDNETTIRLV